MKRISLQNKKLIATLQDTIDTIFDPKIQELIQKNPYKRTDPNFILYEGWEEEYLFEVMKRPLKDYGFPGAINGIELTNLPNQKLFDIVWDKLRAIQNVLGIGQHALSCFYPPKGYIGWHHNGNAPGYNLILTYNPTGDGWFKYYDMKTKQIVTMKDQIGWSVKVGYYGRQDTEVDKIFWHAAYTNSPRLTLSFVMNHKHMWNDVIDDIQTP